MVFTPFLTSLRIHAFPFLPRYAGFAQQASEQVSANVTAVWIGDDSE
jgi:hypothetical protein